MLAVMVKKWKVIKQGLLLEKDNTKINEIVVNGQKIENENLIAESFKNHFKTGAISLDENLPPSQDTCNVMTDCNKWSFKTVS